MLGDYEISFLMPLLSLKEDMESQLEFDDATAFARWIGDNVDPKYHGNPDFIMALFQVCLRILLLQQMFLLITLEPLPILLIEVGYVFEPPNL